MVVVSTLRAAGVGSKLLQLPLSRNGAQIVLRQNGALVQQVRNMGGHKRVMEVLPSRYEYNHWKNLLNYYVLLTAIPLAAIITYSNLFIGNAELTEIPEGYEPKHWEYYKHPISRFFAKYLMEDPVRTYEINLHHINKANRKRQMNLLEWKVKSLMAERQDTKTWYYTPVNSEQAIYASYANRKKEEETFGVGLK